MSRKTWSHTVCRVIILLRTGCTDYDVSVWAVVYRLPQSTACFFNKHFAKKALTGIFRNPYFSFLFFLTKDTTRPRKCHEKEGIEYHFVSKQAFEADAQNNKWVWRSTAVSRCEFFTCSDQSHEVIIDWTFGGELCNCNSPLRQQRVLKYLQTTPLMHFA